ncbi:MAG TPA: DUF1501 domain-containing protein, partial [Pirellulales bacterium]|nr:DUF1501 domain-containing protein [Pirellulales bacterium]
MNVQRPNDSFCRRTRREYLWQVGGGFASLALTTLLDRDGFLATQAVAADGTSPFVNPLAPKPPQFASKAKSVIFLFMYGGPSHVDTFDYKPELYELDGQTIPVKTKGRGGSKNEGRVVGPKWKFEQYGKSGQWVSELFPHLAGCVDDIAFLKSMTADSPIHGSAMLQMNSGRIQSGSPALGSWVNYGLGSVNENLPGFVVMLDPTGGPISGAKNWSSGYMPASYQGSILRSKGAPIIDLKGPDAMTRPLERELLDALGEANHEHLAARGDNSQLAARIASYELAYKMQQYAPEAVDLSQESSDTLALYGAEKERTRDFGRRCLLARRLVERGVRFVQVYSGGGHSDENWDAHGDVNTNHELHCKETDQPMAALLTDLKQRGLLDATLVVWGGEFGRTPTGQGGKGRDHSPRGFSMWMAGGGIKGGLAYGATDDFGFAAVENRVHVHDLHATILHLMGLDHEHLTYFHDSRDMRLTDVEGKVV